MSKSTESPYLPRAPFIDHLTTAPGSKGIGRALIKNAIQKSRSWGDEGKCLLVPLGVGDPGDAQKAYEALGFIELNGGYMLIDPKKMRTKAQPFNPTPSGLQANLFLPPWARESM